MQAIKEKLNDMGAMRKAKAEAKEEEKAEKEVAKTRVQVAHEVRLAREAEAAMDLHVSKAAEKIAQQEAKQTHYTDQQYGEGMQDPYGRDPSHLGTTTDNPYGGGAQDPYGQNTGNLRSAAAGTGYTSNTAGGPPTNNLL